MDNSCAVLNVSAHILSKHKVPRGNVWVHEPLAVIRQTQRSLVTSGALIGDLLFATDPFEIHFHGRHPPSR